MDAQILNELWNIKMEMVRIGDQQTLIMQSILDAMPHMFGIGLGFGFIAALLVAQIWATTWKL